MPNPMRMTSQNTEKGGSKTSVTLKSDPAKRDLAKRRQQNLQAQKRYREKIKRRLSLLETIEASVMEIESNLPQATGRRVVNEANQINNSSPRIEDQGCALIESDKVPAKSTYPFPLNHLEYQTSSSDALLWNSSVSVDPAYLIHNFNCPASTLASRVGHVDCGCEVLHIQFVLKEPREYRDVKSVESARCKSPVADPYSNMLRIDRLCIVQAVFANCEHIGITAEMFCDDDSISPFCKQASEETDALQSERGNKSNSVEVMRCLKPDIKPLKEQITIVHHPVIDVLPFPTLRRNLLRSGNDVDDELYHDLLNGLICWGGTGIARRDRDCSTGSVSTGTPWDSRSWEARTWFLRKYWASLGGADGELPRQSEWWRDMRGEEDIG